MSCFHASNLLKMSRLNIVVCFKSWAKIHYFLFQIMGNNALFLFQIMGNAAFHTICAGNPFAITYFVLVTVCSVLPFLSIMCSERVFFDAAITENPVSDEQYTVPSIGLACRLCEADEFTT